MSMFSAIWKAVVKFFSPDPIPPVVEQPKPARRVAAYAGPVSEQRKVPPRSISRKKK